MLILKNMENKQLINDTDIIKGILSNLSQRDQEMVYFQVIDKQICNIHKAFSGNDGLDNRFELKPLNLTCI